MKITRDEGLKKVLTDALGVGEIHTGWGAREYVKELIDKKLVTNLYMEIPEERGRQIRELSVDKVASYIPDPWGNTASPLGKLVEYARSKGVWIGCYDVAGGDDGVISLNARDELVAKRINAVMEEEKTRIKNVILYGAMHFEDTRQGREGKTITHLCNNLSYVLFDN